ncbi:MAG: hypothetical protein LBK05_01670 [Treponema sp.]|nr:hypothetical protein [Treponema sp.]
MASEKNRRRPHIAWHPAFVQAFRLELEQYQDILEFIPEFQLTSEPLRIDLVVIRKLKNIPIKKNIAAIFRSENLVEYKSPGDHVSVADFYKAYGCACLYASLNAVPVTELTLTFVESREPRKLLKHFREERGYRVEGRDGGIYRVEEDIIPIQVIDSRGLSAGENLWLRGLSGGLEIGLAMDILKEGRERIKKAPLEAYMQVVLNANAGIFLEAGKMGNGSLTFDDVLVELGYTARWEEKGLEKGLEKSVKLLGAYGMKPEQITAALKLTPEQARRYLKPRTPGRGR